MDKTSKLIEYFDNMQELLESEYGYEFQCEEGQAIYKEIRNKLLKSNEIGENNG